MSSLHTVNKSAAQAALNSCLKLVRSGDSILLIEDGVYACAQLHAHAVAGVTLYALREDLLARGLAESALPASIKAVSYKDFVDLVCQHQRSVSWT